VGAKKSMVKQEVIEKARKGKKAAQLKMKLGREPTREEIAESIGITSEDVEDLLALEKEKISLSDKLHGDELEVGDKIEDTITPSVEYEIIKSSIQEQIREILGDLSEKEARVLKLRFGLEDHQVHTLQEIGDMLNLSRERIRQIEQKAMRKLARSQKVQQLRGYLN